MNATLRGRPANTGPLPPRNVQSRPGVRRKASRFFFEERPDPAPTFGYPR